MQSALIGTLRLVDAMPSISAITREERRLTKAIIRRNRLLVGVSETKKGSHPPFLFDF